MKIPSFFACALLAFAVQAGAQTPQPVAPGALKIGKIVPALVKTPEYSLKSGGEKRSTNKDWLEVEVEFETKIDEVDEITFQYVIMFEGKLLDGTVTHVSIPKGREHYSVMYISPRGLEKLTGGKQVNLAGVQNVWVFATKQGMAIDQAAIKSVNPPNLPKLAGYVLNKMETPFAPLWFDRYEAIKAK